MIDILETVRNARKTGHNHNCECRECAPFLYEILIDANTQEITNEKPLIATEDTGICAST
jgi:hypothetical protein